MIPSFVLQSQVYDGEGLYELSFRVNDVHREPGGVVWDVINQEGIFLIFLIPQKHARNLHLLTKSQIIDLVITKFWGHLIVSSLGVLEEEDVRIYSSSLILLIALKGEVNHEILPVLGRVSLFL